MAFGRNGVSLESFRDLERYTGEISMVASAAVE
jgi:hypothetical protein